MAGLDVEQIIKDIYSGMDSPTARRAREQMFKEKSLAADDENYRKRKLFEATELAKQGMADTGALLRQRLTNEGTINVAGITAGAQKYGDDQKLTGDLYKTNALRRASELENETSRLNNAATIRGNIATHAPEGEVTQRMAALNPPPLPDLNAGPAATPSTVTAQASNPIRKGLDKAGQKSMEFPTTESPMAVNKKKRKFLEDYMN